MSDGTGNAGAMGSKHHFYHDMEANTSLSTTIVSALAEVRGVDVASLGFALHDFVDTDALDALFAPKLDGTHRDGSRLELTLLDHSIVVYSDGHVVIDDDDPGPSI